MNAEFIFVTVGSAIILLMVGLLGRSFKGKATNNKLALTDSELLRQYVYILDSYGDNPRVQIKELKLLELMIRERVDSMESSDVVVPINRFKRGVKVVEVQ